MSLFDDQAYQWQTLPLGAGQAVNNSVYHCYSCGSFYPSNQVHFCNATITTTSGTTVPVTPPIDWSALAQMPEKEAVKRFKKYLGERHPKTPPKDLRQLEFCWEGGFDL